MKPTAIMRLLKNANIDFMEHDHPPLFTVEESKEYDALMPGGDCKNMLLTDKKRRSYYLFILDANRRMEIKKMGELIGVKGLKFAKEETLQRFDTFAGSVSPFIILEDSEQEITVYLDAALMNWDRLNFHPNINTKTLGIPKDDFIQFMKAHNHEPAILELED